MHPCLAPRQSRVTFWAKKADRPEPSRAPLRAVAEGDSRLQAQHEAGDQTKKEEHPLS